MRRNGLVRVLTSVTFGLVPVLIFLISGCTSLELYVDFDGIKGIERGARVYHQEVEVGEVYDIRTLEDGRVRTTLHIHPKYQKQLKSNSDVFIKDDSLIPGQKCVYLYPRNESSPPLENGAVIQGASSWEVYLRRGKKALEEIPDLAESIAEELKEATPELRQEILPALLKAKDAIVPLMEHLQEEAPEMLKDFREILEIAAGDFKEEWPELSRELSEVAERLKSILIQIVEDVEKGLSEEDDETEK